jgi:hypothetical protein
LTVSAGNEPAIAVLVRKVRRVVRDTFKFMGTPNVVSSCAGTHYIGALGGIGGGTVEKARRFVTRNQIATALRIVVISAVITKTVRSGRTFAN